jgi:hypothetical protein
MNFQIMKLILWPKNQSFKPKEIEFKLNTINIITGASRTGKSAIIPIIDYCLASGSCYIPVKTIRNACSWFGVLIQTDNKQILLARREPGIQKSTDDMYIEEGVNILTPELPVKNTNKNAIKRYLDELASLSFLDLEANSDNNFLGRPSFRDLMAFCFQPQNIVANANTMFYKADTTEHRTKLINIFPYILGAITPDIIAKRHEISILLKELRRKEKDLAKLKDVAEKWKTEMSGWLAASIEYGLLKSKQDLMNLSFEDQLELLSSLSQKKASDADILHKNIEASSQEIVSLRKEENKISLMLTSFKKRYTEMTQLMESIDNYRESLTIQIDRLHVSKWLKSLTNDDSCPIFGKIDRHPKDIIEKFYSSLIQLEEESGFTASVPAAFEREYENVKTELMKLTEQLEAIQKRINIQSNILHANTDEKYTIENISRFLGQIQYATETFKTIGSDSDLSNEIAELNDRLKDLKSQVNEFVIKQKIISALRKIESFTIKLLPYLDSERPNDPIQMDYENLTIKVSGADGRDDYLWEIGSGSNWLAYHISITLAFQMFFKSQVYSSVPNFIVYDQPSQVYFPQKLSSKEAEKDLDPKLINDEDQIAVKKIFLTMSKSLIDSNKGFQVIVLEHADNSIWGDITAVHEVCEWRGENNKLIPEEWIN